MRLIDADEVKRIILSGVSTDTYEDRIYVCEMIDKLPTIDLVRCGECVHYDTPHVENNGERIEYADLPKEAFGGLITGFVTMSYGINVGGRCTVDYNIGYGEDKRVFRNEGDYCSRGKRKDEPQTTDYCDVCNHKGCDNCVADGSNPYCVPSHYESKTEPQDERRER